MEINFTPGQRVDVCFGTDTADEGNWSNDWFYVGKDMTDRPVVQTPSGQRFECVSWRNLRHPGQTHTIWVSIHRDSQGGFTTRHYSSLPTFTTLTNPVAIKEVKLCFRQGEGLPPAPAPEFSDARD